MWPVQKKRGRGSSKNQGIGVYSIKLVNGLLRIQRNGRDVLDVRDQNRRFADELCELLNELTVGPKLFLNEEDRKWLNEIDGAFGNKVQHA